MKTFNKNIAITIFSLLSVAAMAQVKIGANPTTITANAKLQIEGSTGKKVTVMDNGYVGIGTTAPGTLLEVTGGTITAGPTSGHTGLIWAGTSDIDGFEVITDPTSGDAWVGMQRTGSCALNVAKKSIPATAAGPLLVAFNVGGTVVGSISTNGTSTSYNTTSDERLKENIVSTHFGINDLMKIKVSDFFYKTDKNHASPQTGFIAQQLYQVYPNAVTKGGEDAKTLPWTVDYGKVTPLLVKAIQEQQAEIEALKKENLALKAQSATIEELKSEMASIKKMLNPENGTNNSEKK